MAAITVERLYEISTIIDNAHLAPGNAVEHEKLFDEILQGSKGDKGSKVLAAQFIPKYLKFFQNSMEKVMNTLMDLCEEDEVSIRVSAIRSLPTIAKDTPDSLPKIIDILVQLLQAEDRLELDAVKRALVALFRQDVAGTLDALFTQIMSSEEALREKGVAFIFEKIVPLREELIHPNQAVQKVFSDNIKKILQDASGTEFQLFFDLLRSLPISANSNELLDVVVEQLEASSEFKPDEQSVSVLLICLKTALPYYQKGITNARIAQYLATKVFPVLSQLSEGHQTSVIKQITEIAPHFSSDDSKLLIKPVYELLLANLPQTSGAKTNFTFTEASLLMFHYIAPKAPGALRPLCGITIMTGQPSDLAGEPNTTARKDLDARLKFQEESTKVYVTKVRNALDSVQKELGAAKDAAKKDELTTRKATLELGLKTTQNIQLLAQSLLKPSPTFALLSPSWKAGSKLDTIKGAQKPVPARRIILTKKPAQQPTTTASPKLASAKPAAAATPSPRLISTKPSPKLVSAKPAAAESADRKINRPAFSQVYVPPSRQGGDQPKRKAAEVVEVAGGEKKFRGRGSRTF